MQNPMKQILTTLALFFAGVCMAQPPLVDTAAASRIPQSTATILSQPPLDTDSIARTYSIDDVVISAKSKGKRLGRDVQSHMANIGLPSDIGVECGVLCHTGKQPLRLGTLRIWCSTRMIDTLVFRLNLYSVANGTVGERLAHDPIYIPIRTDSISDLTMVDLKPYDLRVKGDFLLALACAQIAVSSTDNKCEPRSGILFNAHLLARTYLRYSPTETWETQQLGIGLSVEAHPINPNSECL